MRPGRSLGMHQVYHTCTGVSPRRHASYGASGPEAFQIIPKVTIVHLARICRQCETCGISCDLTVSIQQSGQVSSRAAGLERWWVGAGGGRINRRPSRARALFGWGAGLLGPPRVRLGAGLLGRRHYCHALAHAFAFGVERERAGACGGSRARLFHRVWANGNPAPGGYRGSVFERTSRERPPRRDSSEPSRSARQGPPAAVQLVRLSRCPRSALPR